MDILKTILENGFTPTVALVGVCLVCWYIWKQYLRYIRKTSEGISRNYSLVKEVQDLVKVSEQTNKTINEEIENLQNNIACLENLFSSFCRFCTVQLQLPLPDIYFHPNTYIQRFQVSCMLLSLCVHTRAAVQ